MTLNPNDISGVLKFASLVWIVSLVGVIIIHWWPVIVSFVGYSYLYNDYVKRNIRIV